jgi:hypothetical protein
MKIGREGKIEEKRADAADGPVLPSRALTALTTSALALPGIATLARADTPIEQASAGYSFSYYAEDDLDKDQFAIGNGSRQRYEVYTDQFEIDLPISKRMDAGIDFLYEKMTGASPWFVTNQGGKIVQAMSGATISDTRYDLNADLDYYMEESKDTFSAGFSKENDYLSVHGGLGTERNFADKNTTLSASGAFSYDWILPNRAGFPSRQRKGEKWSVDLFTGLSQVLTRASAAQLTVNYKHSNGYLSDPYKLMAVIGSGNVSDKRPNQKDQVSLLARYRHHIEPISASIHFDYRFYVDTWKATSHTFDLTWHQNLFDWLTISPGVRYYSQSKTDFYETLVTLGPNSGDAPRYRSSDFRLSPYGAISWKLKAEISLEDVLSYRASGAAAGFGFTGGLDLFLSFSYERYFSDGAFAIKSVATKDEAPGLVNFQVFAATLTGRF